MEKAKILTPFRIQEVEYLVDIERNGLFLHGDTSGECYISFNNMLYIDDGYKLKYDRKTLRAANPATDPKDVIAIHVPEKKVLNPEGMANHYGLSREEISMLSDFEIMVDPEILLKRVQGELPTVSIGKEQYRMLLESFELSPLGNWGKSLHLSDAFKGQEKGTMEFLYSLNKREIVTHDTNMRTFPEDMILVILPEPVKIDAYAFVQLRDYNFKDTLMKNPPKLSHEAVLKPLSEIRYFQNLVNQNNQQTNSKPKKGIKY